ncbi:MAG: 2-succinyl-5-enolpyruvyl-6-hydroxy-3-cyclohexene-1-carboxylic-acid synthase [bacterium]
MNEFKQRIVNIAELCSQKRIRHVVISPGSRSAPLTLAFSRHPKMRCETVVDERSAAFVALGIAQQSDTPVVLICTSGTAALNYGPAVAEATYQHIPLLVLTADRPPEWIDQNDGQTIVQHQLYAPHCRAFFELPVDDHDPSAKWHTERILCEAINRCLWPIPGPVHVNVPLREPLYPVDELTYDKNPKIISQAQPEMALPGKAWSELLSGWRQARKKLIVAGLQKPVPGLCEQLHALQQDPGVVFLSDVTGNCQAAQTVAHSDMILSTDSDDLLAELQPDLLITFGGPVVSKSLKLFLRRFRPRAHWQLQRGPNAVDTFQSLTQILPVEPPYFVQELLARTGAPQTSSGPTYRAVWQQKETTAQDHLARFLRPALFSELSAMRSVLRHLPPESHLQLGNSSIVRLANFISLVDKPGVRVNSNRGTSGIDGTVSTAVGAALATHMITTLITGDLAFFYDRNGLWCKTLPANLRIIIFNNGGGGIFRILDGSRTLPELTDHFEVAHNLTARNTAADHNLDYFWCDSKASLQQHLSAFFADSERPAILEVAFNKMVNSEMFLRFKKIMREIR